MSPVAAAERLARAALSRLGEPGDPRLTGLVARLGAQEVRARLVDHRGTPGDGTGLRSDLAERLAGLDPEAELVRAQAAGIRFVCPGDDEWPEGLDDLDHAGVLAERGGVPVGLWVRGALPLRETVARSVSVVGSRSATTYGTRLAGDVGAHLARKGWTTISGAAFGIDQAGHRGALAGEGATVAVLACGVDRSYPAAHAQLIDLIADHGCVVSEAAPGCSPTRVRFLARNRLIAAMARGTVVVEAAVRSGALNTASWSGLAGRPVMAVPGPVTSAASAGAHQLVRSGAAQLVTTPAEVLELVAPSGEHTVAEPRGRERPRDRLGPVDQQLLDAVPVHQPADLASLSRTAGLSAARIRVALPRLERDGYVVRVGEGWRLSG